MAQNCNLQDAQSEAYIQSEEVTRELEIARHGSNMSATTSYQKMIESKEREIRETIMANYERMKEVEKELREVQLQLQVNVGPRKHALEMLRHKIERQTERVSSVRQRCAAAKAVAAQLEAELVKEEAVKEQLCTEMNILVQQSATSQLAKLEELKNTLEHLNRGMAQATHQGHAAHTAAAAATAATPSNVGQVSPAAKQVVSHTVSAPASASNGHGERSAQCAVAENGPGAGAGPQRPTSEVSPSATSDQGRTAGGAGGDGSNRQRPCRSGAGGAVLKQQQQQQQPQQQLSAVEMAEQEVQRRQAAAEAAAARARHASINPISKTGPSGGRGRGAPGAPHNLQASASSQRPAPDGSQKEDQRFSGFDV